jgi:hypothetical protein
VDTIEEPTTPRLSKIRIPSPTAGTTMIQHSKMEDDGPPPAQAATTTLACRSLLMPITTPPTTPSSIDKQ